MTQSLTHPASPTPGRLTQRDRRGFRRVPLMMTGRFLTEDEQDHPLRTNNISCDGALILSDYTPPLNAAVICYFDQIGRVAAHVMRHTAEGFAVRFQTSAHKRDKLADRLTWLLNKDALGLEEDRESPRQQADGEALVHLSDGRQLTCAVTDISLTGAAFEAHGTPPYVGEKVTVGNLYAEVVRVSGNTFAIRYLPGARPDGAEKS